MIIQPSSWPRTSRDDGRPLTLTDKQRLVTIVLGVACSIWTSTVAPRTAAAQTVAEIGTPDPLRRDDGTVVASPKEWGTRRAELIAFFTREMYGRAPGRPRNMTFEVVEGPSKALGDVAIRKQVEIRLTGQPAGPRLNLLLYLPSSAKGPVPVILGMNFWGNQAVHPDPGIRLPTSRVESGRNPYVDLSGVQDHRATDATRGINASQWPVEEILARGFGFATLYRGDVDPDTPDGLDRGVRGAYPDLKDGGDNFGVIGAWAWAFSRAIDYLETDINVDPKRIAIFGWSRLGKAALWAGATDERVALVIANESGAGGAKLFRRGVGEDIRRLTTVFPHWYCDNFRKYAGRDKDLPFDQHMVITLIAPRPVCLGSAAEDKGADPEGEFLGAKGADPVYRLLGTEGLPAKNWPPVNQPTHGAIGYHLRPGKHDVTGYDWVQFLDFAERHLKKP